VGEERTTELIVSMLANLAAATLAVASPEAAIPAAGMVPLAEEGLGHAVDRLRQRVRGRQVEVIEMASDIAGLQPPELVARLSRDEQALVMLADALTGAARAVGEAKVRALATALAEVTGDLGRASVEHHAVRALSDLEVVHVEVLRAFTRTSNQLGLGDGTQDFDVTVSSLNRVQLADYVFTDMGWALEPALATLLRHGLLRSGGGTWADVEGNTSYFITPFGTECLRRLEVA
jgi:hypothetical protein